jgi:hypothetical protein
MPSTGRHLLLTAVLLAGSMLPAAALVRAGSIDWPLSPRTSPHALGNSYGEYQYYGGAPYYHPGIDILGAPGDSVFAVKAGYVKAVLTTAAELHWRVAVGDSAGTAPCDAYLYAHLDLPTIQVAPGDTVAEGEFLGQIVTWPVAQFHHVHFVKIRNSGFPWSDDWQFIGDPLHEIQSAEDLTAPEFVPLVNGSYFAFYPNNGTTYLAPGSVLSGPVDFLVSVRDKINHPTWWVAPYEVHYRFRSDSLSYGPVLSVRFRDTLWWDQNVSVIYRDDATYDSKGDYSDREYYIICTNTDNDPYIEASDADSAWFTGDYPNGTYWLTVEALDRWGNRAAESTQVVLGNIFALTGHVTLADLPPSQAGTVVSIEELGLSDTTDAAGDYALDGIGPGAYTLIVRRPNYDSMSVATYLKRRDSVRDFTLQPVFGLRGDINHSQTVDAADVILLVNYVFRSGPAPDPISQGDVDGTPPITSSDIIFLVNYVFKGGPPPPPL